jgi:hypothetical protein
MIKAGEEVKEAGCKLVDGGYILFEEPTSSRNLEGIRLKADRVIGKVTLDTIESNLLGR